MSSVSHANAILLEGSRRIHLLAPGTYIVGRSRRSDIRLEDTRVSRQHLQLDLSEAGLSVLELNSKNGTQLNGERLETTRQLRVGDRLEVGSHVLQAIQHAPTLYAPGHSLLLVGQEAHSASGTTEVTARVLDLLDVLTDSGSPGYCVPETVSTVVAVVDDLLDRAGMTQPYLTQSEAARLTQVVDIITQRSPSTTMLRWRSGAVARMLPLVERGRHDGEHGM